MSRYRKFTTICCAAVFALGLAACGGGGNDGLNTSQEQELQNQVAMLQGQVSALRARLGIDDDSDPGHDVATLQTEIDRLEGLLKEKNDAEAAAMAKAMAAKLQKLATGIGAVDQAGTPAVPTRAADARKMGKRDTALDAPYTISGWSGMSWQSKAGSGATATTTTAVVYNDKEADKPAAFNKRFTIIGTGLDNAGTVALTTTEHSKLVGGISGLPTHPSHPGVQVGVTNGVKGTLAGATGRFLGVGTPAVVSIDADGNLTWTGGALHFKPDSATATVMMPDTSYSSLGWWLTEAANGDLTPEVAAWSSDDYTGTLPQVGKATYAGVAVGKYTHKTINDIEGGHFNADAEFVAEFDTGGTTITGTIDNFMSDGESIGDGWKVELANTQTTAADFDADVGAAITATPFTAAQYSARGTFGSQKTFGTWTAGFVDDSRKDTMPGGVVGTFQIGETAHPINMVGAFAASNQEADLPN